ncbi:MAG: fumarylacetoacetate hydrolase family protein [Pseudomonadota bacterium]
MRSVNFAGQAITPSKILCVGRNYVAHISELGNDIPDDMVIFIKPNSAIGHTLNAKVDGEVLHYEGELVFLVSGNQFVAVGFGIDLTRRQLQSTLKDKGLPWERAKAFDGAALFSDFVALPEAADHLYLRLDIDGQTRQFGGVESMIYKPDVILRELQAFTTLEDGDLVMTGTPAGVGAVQAGETFHGSVLLEGDIIASASWSAI